MCMYFYVNILALGKPVIMLNKEPPIMRLCSQQPCLPVKNVDPTRAKKAFGRWALPRLVFSFIFVINQISQFFKLLV